MNVYVNTVRGMDDAIVAMYMSKPGSWNKELQDQIYETVHENTDHFGHFLLTQKGLNFENMKEGLVTCPEGHPTYDIRKKEIESIERYQDWMSKLLKWGRKHVTMLRYIDISITVEGLHRAGQDDLDAHAKRMDNRILRNSTREVSSEFGSKVSEYYEDKVIPTDVAMAYLGIETPPEIEYNGKIYVRAANGYILKGMENTPDVRRGLFYLALPSNCIFKVNLTEFAHIYKMRHKGTRAHPELQRAIEMICDQLPDFYPDFTRELLQEIDN